MLRRIVFHGYLADEYGQEMALDVASVGEACRAIQANRKTFYNKIRDGKFHIVVGDRWEATNCLSDKELNLNVGAGTIHIIPVIAGSGGNGFFQIVLGVAMIAAAVVMGPVGLGVGGFMSGAMESGLVLTGALMILGGVAALLSPTPDQHNSYLFNGALNTTVQGGPVPVIYGTMMAGSTLISSGLSNAQLLGNPATSASDGTWWNVGVGEYAINLYTGPATNGIGSGIPLPPGITISPAPTAQKVTMGLYMPYVWTEAAGANLSLTFTAAGGDSISHIYVDGLDVYDGTSNPFTYTFTNLQANHHLSVAGT